MATTANTANNTRDPGSGVADTFTLSNIGPSTLTEDKL